MKLFFKTIFILLLAAVLSLGLSYFFWYRTKFRAGPHSYTPISEKNSRKFEKLQSKAKALKLFAEKKNFNPDICFLIDMSIASGKKRFFVYDVAKDSVMLEGLVAHGSCDDGFQADPVFSNKINSGCSCLGRFKVGYSYNGNFGTAFKLTGLDSSNNNAFDRTIVLHSYECVPEEETYPLPICNSRGCPMVSPGFFAQLKPIIKQSKKPLLLWIYE
jgi:L,D-transpeptidase catalytic domain